MNFLSSLWDKAKQVAQNIGSGVKSLLTSSPGANRSGLSNVLSGTQSSYPGTLQGAPASQGITSSLGLPSVQTPQPMSTAVYSPSGGLAGIVAGAQTYLQDIPNSFGPTSGGGTPPTSGGGYTQSPQPPVTSPESPLAPYRSDYNPYGGVMSAPVKPLAKPISPYSQPASSFYTRGGTSNFTGVSGALGAPSLGGGVESYQPGSVDEKYKNVKKPLMALDIDTQGGLGTGGLFMDNELAALVRETPSGAELSSPTGTGQFTFTPQSLKDMQTAGGGGATVNEYADKWTQLFTAVRQNLDRQYPIPPNFTKQLPEELTKLAQTPAPEQGALRQQIDAYKEQTGLNADIQNEATLMKQIVASNQAFQEIIDDIGKRNIPKALAARMIDDFTSKSQKAVNMLVAQLDVLQKQISRKREDFNQWLGITETEMRTAQNNQGEARDQLSMIVKNAMDSGDIVNWTDEDLQQAAQSGLGYTFSTLKAMQQKAATPKEFQTTSRQAAIMDLYNKGITDPSQIFDYVNFDDGGKQIGDISLSEITSVINGIKPKSGTTDSQFWTAIDKARNELQQGETWGNVWNRIRMQFPDKPASEIDAALGGSWNSKTESGTGWAAQGAYQTWKKSLKISSNSDYDNL